MRLPGVVIAMVDFHRVDILGLQIGLAMAGGT